jgi:hypothetical protein
VVRLIYLGCALSTLCVGQPIADQHPSFDYEVARTHEIKPHRRTIPIEGIRQGFNQLRLTVTVSTTGEVLDAKANGNKDSLKLWPKLEAEVRAWRFVPFERYGKAVVAEIAEYIDLVPPERFPTAHVPAPAVGPNSKISIALERSGCYGSCPGYTVAINNSGIIFEGRAYIVASGRHADRVDEATLGDLVNKFVRADFYSMESEYSASVTDCPAYILSISIDGNEKRVVDYMGEWMGMPAAIRELEDEVDSVARTGRWISGSAGLVAVLQKEKFDFRTLEAQIMLKEAAARGAAGTVRELLAAGVSLTPILPPKSPDPSLGTPFENVGWLNAASQYPEVLQVLMDAGASKHDQGDKDLALVGAARSGAVSAAKALIAYGASPNTDLAKLIVTQGSGGMTISGPGSGSVLIIAAESGNPEMISEILRYKPRLEARNRDGKTALFVAAEEYRDSDKEGARVRCVRMLSKAGAKVDVRDKDGNTALHETFQTDVAEELLKLGADVNARNKDGETPIFTTVDQDAVGLFVKHGADLSIHNKEGNTVMDIAKKKGVAWQEALRKAIEEGR